MIVCHCVKTTCCDIKKAYEEGARTVEDVTRKCGAGGCCGGCKPTIQDLLDEHQLTEKLKNKIRKRDHG